MNKQLTNKGFTIIEVVLVLAIAGLIFLMVFVALPALQAGQRDTARKNDASAVISAVNTYMSGNRGKFPLSANLQQFSADVSTNTDAAKINVVAAPASLPGNITVGDTEVIVVQGTTCGDIGKVGDNNTASQQLKRGTKNQYTATVLLEGGGGVSYCVQS